MSTKTIESIIESADFDRRIAALSNGAGDAGDYEQVAICYVAVGERVHRIGDLYLSDRQRLRVASMTQDDARRECARVLLNAEAQADA
jgi:hypothetical protein